MRILVGRGVDTDNTNAQSQNVQALLSRWKSEELRPAAVFFRQANPALVNNPRVDLFKIKPDRLWRLRWVTQYFKSYHAVFYPGMHHFADWFALRCRRTLGRQLLIISTLEGLAGPDDDPGYADLLSCYAGHPVYCQQLRRRHFDRLMDIYRMSDEIIAISPFLKNISTKLLGKNISFLPLGVDTSQFVRNSPARNSRPQVVCAGHVAAHKRPEKFLEWASLYPMADFSWYGEGPLRSILIHKAKHQGLLNVSFPGELPRVELADRFKGGDIFALPSLSEGVPKVTQEAAAAGLAQVIFGFYESPTVVEGENGFVVWNDDEFTQRLGQLVEDRTLVAKMGRTGSEMARQWEWDLIAPLWEEMIFRFVKNNRGPESRPVRNL